MPDLSVWKSDVQLIPYLSPNMDWSSLVLELHLPPQVNWNILYQVWQHLLLKAQVFSITNNTGRIYVILVDRQWYLPKHWGTSVFDGHVDMWHVDLQIRMFIESIKCIAKVL